MEYYSKEGNFYLSFIIEKLTSPIAIACASVVGLTGVIKFCLKLSLVYADMDSLLKKWFPIKTNLSLPEDLALFIIDN